MMKEGMQKCQDNGCQQNLTTSEKEILGLGRLEFLGDLKATNDSSY